MHDARAVANLIIEKAAKEGRTLDIWQVMNIVYLANGWHLAWYGKPLIRDPIFTSVEAMKRAGDE